MSNTINIEMIRKLKHVLGFDIIKPKRGKFSAYRNYYDSGSKQDPDWEEAIESGYAIRVQGNAIYKGWWYKVSDKGIKMLEDITGLKIVETN